MTTYENARAARVALDAARVRARDAAAALRATERDYAAAVESGEDRLVATRAYLDAGTANRAARAILAAAERDFATYAAVLRREYEAKARADRTPPTGAESVPYPEYVAAYRAALPGIRARVTVPRKGAAPVAPPRFVDGTGRVYAKRAYRTVAPFGYGGPDPLAGARREYAAAKARAAALRTAYAARKGGRS